MATPWAAKDLRIETDKPLTNHQTPAASSHFHLWDLLESLRARISSQFAVSSGPVRVRIAVLFPFGVAYSHGSRVRKMIGKRTTLTALAAILAAAVLPFGNAEARKEAVLYSFCGQASCTDGAFPGTLLYQSGTLFGTTA